MANRTAALDNKQGTGFRERVALCTTTYDVLRLTKSVAAEYGFGFFAILRLPSSKDEKLAPLSVVTNWPEELLKEYDERGLLKESPIFNSLKSSTRPYIWSHHAESRHYLQNNDPEVERLFCSFGLCSGVYFSVQDPAGKRGALSLAGDRPTPTEGELAELSYFANLVYQRVWELKRGTKAPVTQKLSARENECLMWTASGKTSAEIAIILKLSEHTVNHYLTSACQKLGATNRAHAVYKAMRAGVIE